MAERKKQSMLEFLKKDKNTQKVKKAVEIESSDTVKIAQLSKSSYYKPVSHKKYREEVDFEQYLRNIKEEKL